MAQETFTLTLDGIGQDVDVVINDTSNVPYVDFIGTSSDTSTTWTVPSGVTTISAVTIGGGGDSHFWTKPSQSLRKFRHPNSGGCRTSPWFAQAPPQTASSPPLQR